jgi:sarcosine oxidase subunit beta
VELPTQADVVVIGGGVMGASSAYHLLKSGVHDVLLLEKESFFGQGATGRCAGGVRYQFATEVNVRLSIASLAMINEFKSETGQDPLYRKCGYLFVITDPADVPTFQRNIQMQNGLGVGTVWLSGDNVRSKLPTMRFEDALGGSWHERDGLADPNSIVMGYIKRIRELGGVALTDQEVLSIGVESGRITSVTTRSGSVACGSVINAAGPWMGLIGQMVGVEIPLEPIRRQMVTTTPLPELPEDFPFVIDFSRSLYFHREGEGILTGMSNPDEQAGFDQSIDEEWELIAMDAAAERLPMLNQAGRLAGWAGLYEVTPDAHPIFGRSPIDGFWLVGGFSGHGFMHGPIAGKLMAEILTSGQAVSVDVSMLDLARFDENRLIHEYNVV